jgi:hypothetical protein
MSLFIYIVVIVRARERESTDIGRQRGDTGSRFLYVVLHQGSDKTQKMERKHPIPMSYRVEAST